MHGLRPALLLASVALCVSWSGLLSRPRSRTGGGARSVAARLHRARPLRMATLGMPPPPSPNGSQQARRSPEYQLNVGKATDTLRADLPYILTQEPDLSIYAKHILVTDPSGMSLKGIDNYQRVWSTLRLMAKIMLSSHGVELRLMADGDKGVLRVRWIMSGNVRASTAQTRLEGVSTYAFDSEGLINKHAVDYISINGIKMEPPYLNALLGIEPWTPVGVPSGLGVGQLRADGGGAAAGAAVVVPLTPLRFDEPLTIMANDGNSAAEDGVAVPRAADGSAESAGDQPEKKEGGGMFDWLPKIDLSFDPPEQCETAWDCEDGMNCCDFLVAKVCCSGGEMSPTREMQLEYLTIPIPIDDGYQRGNDGRYY